MSFDLSRDDMIFQGAESRVYKSELMGLNCIIKERFPKKYRCESLDVELTKSRTKSEIRNLAKLRGLGIRVPYVLNSRVKSGIIVMEYIEGETVADFLFRESSWTVADSDLYQKLPDEIGTLICRLHDEARITHGDLTTSNLMIPKATNTLVLLDFGLASTGVNAEQRAVDLYVFIRSIKSSHADLADDFISKFLEAYRACSPCGEKGYKQLLKVQTRGRKRNLSQ